MPRNDPTARTLDGTSHLRLPTGNGIHRSELERQYLEDKALQKQQDLALHDGLQVLVTGLISYRKQLLHKLYENNLHPIPIITWQVPSDLNLGYKSESDYVSLMLVSNNDKLGLCINNSGDSVFYLPTHDLTAAKGALQGNYPQERIFWGRHLPVKSIVFNSSRTVTGGTVRVAAANLPLQGMLYSLGLKSLPEEWMAQRIKAIASQDLASILEEESHKT